MILTRFNSGVISKEIYYSEVVATRFGMDNQNGKEQTMKILKAAFIHYKTKAYRPYIKKF